MALISSVCSVVFLLAVMTFATCVSASDSDDYIFGATEDKLLLACVIMFLVVGVVLLIVAVVVPFIAMRWYKRSVEKRYHTGPPATRPASQYSGTHRNKTAEGNGNYESDGEGISNGGFDSVKINGVVYANPAAADDASSRQSFENPAYEHGVVAKPIRVSAEGDTAL